MATASDSGAQQVGETGPNTGRTVLVA
ncbi:MAG: hypothetical protein QOD82_4437, partial [Pseudonocardiales bacterium]|nr:hypothetical protein [Pseudonocardiales bacterium]